MAIVGEKIEKGIIINKIMRTLTKIYNHVALIIEETKDLLNIEIDNFIGSLTWHKERVLKRTKILVSNNDEQAFSIKENEG